MNPDNEMPGDRERCLSAGMDDYIPKPAAPQKLAETLVRWLPEGTAGKRAPEASAVQKAQEPGVPVFDRAGMMVRLMDDEELAGKILEGFLDDIPRQFELLRRHLAAKDAPSTELQIHSVKGAAAYVGGEALRAVAFDLEKAARAGDLTQVKARLAELEGEFERLKEAIKSQTV